MESTFFIKIITILACLHSLLHVVFCLDCSDAFSCAFTPIIPTENSDTITCFGYKSCFESPRILGLSGGVACDGSHSCTNTRLMMINGSKLDCNGFKSCSSINNLKITNSRCFCVGDQSCYNTKIFIGGNINSKSRLRCLGMLSCANSIITLSSPNANVAVQGYLAAFNTTFISQNDTKFSFTGHNAGYSIIICSTVATCSIYCHSDGCNNITLLCDNSDVNVCTWYIECESAAKSDLCPNGYDVINTYTLSRDRNAITGGIVDYKNIGYINVTDGLNCNDYQECLEYMFDLNSSYSTYDLYMSYIQTVNYNNNTENGYATLTKSVYCGGSRSCFFTNMVFNVNSSKLMTNNTNNTNYNQNTLLVCDGFEACLNIPNFVLLNSSSNGRDENTVNIRFRGSSSGEGINVVTNNTANNNSGQIILNVTCTGYNSCRYQTIENITNVFCHGLQSCFYSRIFNIGNGIWVYGAHGMRHSIIDNVMNNLYFNSYWACGWCNVSNINGNIYGIGGSSLSDARIKHVDGNIFGLATASLYSTTIVNAKKVYCVSEISCKRALIRSVGFILITHPTAISYATIVSDMTSKITNTSTRFSNHNSNTMILEIYSFSFDFSIYCSDKDICKIGCFSQNACANLQLYCNGTCLVDCDDEPGYQCPTIKLGTYSVWYSNITGNNNNNAANNNSINSGTDDNNTNNENNRSQRLYNAVVIGFSAIILSATMCTVAVICCCQCAQSFLLMIKVLKSEINDKKNRYCTCNFSAIIIQFCNADFFVFVLVFCVCMCLGFVCILYGFGQITQLILSNYWCEKKQLNEIYQHSQQFNLNHGTNDGCWKSKQFTVDTYALFQSSSVYSTESDFSTVNVCRCIIWLLASVSFIWMGMMFLSLHLSNVIFGKICFPYHSSAINDDIPNSAEMAMTQILKNKNNSSQNQKPQRIAKNNTQNSQHKAKKGRVQQRSSSFHKCCPCCCLPRNNKCLEFVGDAYFRYIKWYRFYLGEDTRNWFILLSIREMIEITLQILAAYSYNGFNVFSPDQLVLAFKPNEIRLFCLLLSLNCFFTGILWLFYVFFHKLCHGQLFKQVVFFVDTTFDTFYALFPIIVVGQQNKFKLRLAVAVLQAPNMYVLYVYSLCILK